MESNPSGIGTPSADNPIRETPDVARAFSESVGDGRLLRKIFARRPALETSGRSTRRVSDDTATARLD